MLFAVCIAVVLTLVNAQNQGALHGICHSNHQQLVEDQVIENVVRSMNLDPTEDDTIEQTEVLIFFADLMGITLDSAIVDLLGDMTDEQLLQTAGGFNIGRNDLAQAWHGRYHDSMEFIRATFDVFDTNGDGFLNISEIQGIVDLALQTDLNGDGELQVQELIVFLESIYKNC